MNHDLLDYRILRNTLHFLVILSDPAAGREVKDLERNLKV